MRNITRTLVLVFLSALLIMTVVPTLAQEATAEPSMWDDSSTGWREAGGNLGCEDDPAMTTAAAQEALGYPVVRQSHHGCSFVLNIQGGQSVQLMLPAGWVAISYDDPLNNVVTVGTGQLMTTSWSELFYLQGDADLTMDTINELALEPRNEGCALTPSVNAATVAEALQPVGEAALRLAKLDEEPCGFVIRGTTAGSASKATFPEGYIATIHPMGEDSVHNNGEDDIVYMWVGTPQDASVIHNIWAMTVRAFDNYPAGDVAKDDHCGLWAKEIANAALDVPQFLVAKGNLPCAFDEARVRQYITDAGGDPAVLDDLVDEYQALETAAS